MLNRPTDAPSAFAAFHNAGARPPGRDGPGAFGSCTCPSVKPKIPCFPGFTPVKIDVQPGGV